jgi:hypothetical protein
MDDAIHRFTDEEILKLRDYFQHGVPVKTAEGEALCDQLLSERAWYRAATADAAVREGAAILLQVAEMEEHNEAIFNGKWKKGSKAWSGAFIARLRKEGMAKVREAMTSPKAGEGKGETR